MTFVANSRSSAQRDVTPRLFPGSRLSLSKTTSQGISQDVSQEAFIRNQESTEVSLFFLPTQQPEWC